uniref:Major capsid protein n=1 Tax=uncultured marine virus TaxID=186617 RepID=A0A0F7LAA8_9VIRU|nr:major capsid protein [uncultured marine virus]
MKFSLSVKVRRMRSVSKRSVKSLMFRLNMPWALGKSPTMTVQSGLNSISTSED